MKRTCLLSTAAIVASLSTASVASAETKPAIVYIPTADVDLTPSGSVDTACAKASMSSDVPAAGCINATSQPEAGTATPHTNAQDIVDGVTTALAAYDVMVVTDPPAAYVPVFAVLSNDDASKKGTSYTCSGAGITCAARGRDSWGFTNTGTMNCTDPDLVQSALYTIGRMAGLEGTEGTDDAMSYPPDYETPVVEFADRCLTIAPRLDGETGEPLPLECTSADHAGDCEAGEQNSNADLMDYFGANAADEDAPEIGLETPADGDVIAEGGALVAEGKLTDASNYAAVRITIASPALETQDAIDAGIVGGEITFCTTDVCDVNFLDGNPFKTADSDWSTGEITGLPGGEYTVTLEASDYYGNEAAPVVAMVTLEGGPIDPTGGDTDTAGDDSGGQTTGDSATNGDDSGFLTTGDDSGGSSDGDTESGGSGGSSDGGGGCSVGPEQGIGGTLSLMLGLFGLGFIRRRR